MTWRNSLFCDSDRLRRNLAASVAEGSPLLTNAVPDLYDGMGTSTMHFRQLAPGEGVTRQILDTQLIGPGWTVRVPFRRFKARMYLDILCQDWVKR
jgi:hypothetical protein